MWSIAKKEVLHLLGNSVGYVAIGVYIVFCGLYLFVFPDSNVFDYKYATLAPYFDMAPWVFMFLIPAMGMRTLSEEMRSGTMERLVTLPLTLWEIVLGKYLAIVFVSLLCILFSLPFLITVNALADSTGFDVGATVAGYFALFFLSLVFNSIVIFASATQKQMVISFFMGALLCFILYIGFQSLSFLKIVEGNGDYYLQLWGIQSHFNSMKRGVIDLRDVVYFLSVSVFFLYLSVHYLRRSIYRIA